MNGLESLKQGFPDMFNVFNNWFLGWPLCEKSHGRLFFCNWLVLLGQISLQVFFATNCNNLH